MDRTGVFAGDLVVVTTEGEVWRINPAGVPTNLVAADQDDADGNPLVRQGKVVHVNNVFPCPDGSAYCPVELEGVFTVPNLPERYGRMAGKILAGAEELHRLYAIAPNGTVEWWEFDGSDYFLEIEDLDVVLAGHNFFGAGQSTGRMLAAPEGEFASLTGELVATQEFGGTGTALYRLYWERPAGSTDPLAGRPHAQFIPRTSDSAPFDNNGNPIDATWEHVTFAPAGIVPATGTGVARGSFKPGLAGWTIFLDQNRNGHRDSDERFTTTDAAGSYVFERLAPGTYYVAEEQQPDWEQTFPLAAPNAPTGPRVHTITVTGEQWLGGNDFGNKPIVQQPNRPPQFTTNPNEAPFPFGAPGFRYFASAFDPDGDPLRFDLSFGPIGMMVEESTGIVVWKPTIDQVGNHDVLVRVRDDEAAVDLQFFTLTVTVPNTAPVITSTPPGPAAVGLPYEYQVRAQDADGDPISFTLLTDPAPARPYFYAVRAIDPDGDVLTFSLAGGGPVPIGGLSIDPVTGLLRWDVPTFGVQEISILVTDGFGGEATQSYSLVVSSSSSNRTPVISSVPPQVASVGELYRYEVTASDPDDDTVAFSLVENPTNMTIDPASGVVTWTPSAGQLSPPLSTVTVRATDPSGLKASQRYQIVVRSANLPPSITSIAPITVAAGATYRYDVRATDPNGDPLSYSFVRDDGTGNFIPCGAGVPPAPGCPPDAMTLDAFGRVTWPTTLADIDSDKSDPDNDPYPLTIQVSDDRGAAVRQAFSLTVLPDTVAPSVDLRLDPNPANPNETVLALVSASDNVGVATLGLTWCRLDTAQPPQCIGTPTNLPLDARGTATISFSQISDYRFTASAADAAGNSASTSKVLQVLDTQDTQAPTVSITKLRKGTDSATDIPASGAIITDPWNVVGSVTSNNLQSWTLAIAPERVQIGDDWRAPNDADFRVIFSHSCAPLTSDPCPLTSVSGVLAALDPTMLPNGPYILRLSAISGTATAPHQSATEVVVHVTGNLKLGNFTLSFTDLAIPVSGIPITVSRTYDTLRANEHGDFGYGWKLDMWDADIKVDERTLGLGSFGVFKPFIDGTRVTITASGGKPEDYTFEPWSESRFFGLVTVWHPRFTPDPGVHSDLAVPDVSLTKVGDEYVSLAAGGISYNPADPAFGGTYDYSTLAGTKHQIDATTGELLTLSDHNSNTLRFGSIESDTGRKVDFERDERGRITAVIDPKGSRIEYEYDARGDLVSVKDRVGNVTRFSYAQPSTLNPQPPAHFIATASDPLGVTAFTAAYDTAQRIDEITDAAGKKVAFDFDPSARSQTMTDQVGTPATIGFDPRGNMTRAVAGPGGSSGCAPDGITCTSISRAMYDADDNVTSQTVIVGGEDGAGNTESDDITTTASYNQYGAVVTQTDPLGNETRFVYDGAAQLTAVSDPLGNTSSYWYTRSGFGAGAGGYGPARRGNVMLTTDPLDNSTFFEYDGRGNVTAITAGAAFSNWLYGGLYGGPFGGIPGAYDPNCSVTQDRACYPTDPSRRPELTKTRFTYNPYGDLTSTTDPQNVTRTFSNDGNGNQTGSTFVWVNPNNPADTRTVTTTNVINGNDQVRESIGPEGTSLTDYDVLSRPFKSTDRFGGIAQSKFDARGLTIESTSPDGQISRAVYDDKGRAIWTVDSHLPGQPADGTHIIFDKLDRVVRTDRYSNVVIDLIDDTSWPGAKRSVLTSSGVLLSTSSSTFDPAGRTATSISIDGHVMRYEYDRAGRQTAMLENVPIIASAGPCGDPASGAPPAGCATRRTESVYDPAGRQTINRDPLGRETRSDHDDAGNAVKTIFVDGTFVTTTFDIRGRSIAETDQMGLTKKFEYDKGGRLTAVLLPPVTDPEAAPGSLPVSPRYEYQYDQYGNRTLIRDPKGRETRFTFDQFGRQLTRRLPDGLTEEFRYNSLGQQTLLVDFEGRVTEMVYDNTPAAGGRLFQKRFFLNLAAWNNGTGTPTDAVTYVYDSQSRLSAMSESWRGTTSYSYDVENRITRIASPEGVINYEYDPVTGRRTRTFTGSAADPINDFRYTYDELGRLKTVEVWERNNSALPASQREITSYQYDILGNLDRVDLPNGIIDKYLYDSLSRLDKLTHYSPDATPNDLTNNAKLAEFDYTVRADGKRTAETSTIWQSGTPQTIQTNWTYDNDGRLTDEVLNHYDNLLDFTAHYDYDLVGNRVKKTLDQGSNGSIDETIT